MTSSIMGVAQAGLQAAQAGLLVTSQNITGSSVEGYSRRDASTVINRLAPNAVGVFGTGFSVEGFTRDYSRLLENQRLTQQGKTSYYDTLVETTELIDKVIADESNSLAIAITEFFDAAGQMVGAPESIAYRSNLTHKADLVAQRFVGLSETVNQVDKDSRNALRTTLERVNTLTEQLALLNGKLKEGLTIGNIEPSADYLDERDRVLMELQTLVGGQVLINSDSTASHYLNGVPIVEGGIANRFLTTSIEGDMDNLRIQFTTFKTLVEPAVGRRDFNLTTRSIATEFISGGQAGAFIKLIRDFVPETSRRIDAVAIGLLKTVNSISPNPIFGFRVTTGQIVSNPTKDDFARNIPTVRSPADIYLIRDNLDPEDSNFSPGMAQLRSANFISVAPQDANEYQIEADDVYKIEALRSTFSDPVADIVGKVGNTIAQWVNDSKANQSVMKALNDRRETVSGVNLDEEAANMVKFQQLYSASSKIIQTGNQLFETLLAMVSR
jgi:flagellar hook-associated protein 1 FlgK